MSDLREQLENWRQHYSITPTAMDALVSALAAQPAPVEPIALREKLRSCEEALAAAEKRIAELEAAQPAHDPVPLNAVRAAMEAVDTGRTQVARDNLRILEIHLRANTAQPAPGGQVALPEVAATVCLTPDGYAHGHMLDLQVQAKPTETFKIGDRMCRYESAIAYGDARAAAMRAALNAGDTCARACEAQAVRIEAAQLKRRVAELEARAAAAVREAESEMRRAHHKDTMRLLERAENAERELRKAHMARAVAAVPEGWKLVQIALFEQVYGMARQGCDSPSAAYRWCERIDEILHAGEASGEFSEWALDLPPAMLAAAPQPEANLPEVPDSSFSGAEVRALFSALHRSLAALCKIPEDDRERIPRSRVMDEVVAIRRAMDQMSHPRPAEGDSKAHMARAAAAAAAVPEGWREDVHLAAQMLTWHRGEGLTDSQVREVLAHRAKLFAMLAAAPQPATCNQPLQVQPEATDIQNSLSARLRAACVGHPYAMIPWPHRILREAADRIDAIELAAPVPAECGEAVGVVCLTPDSYAHGAMVELQVQLSPGANIKRGTKLYAGAPTAASGVAIGWGEVRDGRLMSYTHDRTDACNVRIFADGPPADAEALIRECVPGGDICDPQQVADNIREYFGRLSGGEGL